MHGRPRKPLTAEEEKKYSEKAVKLRLLQSQFLHFHLNRIYTEEALNLNAKLVEANPEYLTAWNYRKLAVEHILNDPASEKKDTDSIRALYGEELKVTQRALSRNYKCYGAWYHRKWVIRKGFSSIDDELKLLDVFLSKDSRNFHAWNYRRFVIGLMNRSDEEELQFTTDVVSDNFSNYSAWHYRSMILSRLLEKRVEPKGKILTEEFDLVHQAIFTDPNDQSGWFYHLWLLNQTIKSEYPHLVSTWPHHHSNIHISENCSSSHLRTGTVPLVLIFSEAVIGVNSSTITVEMTDYHTKEDDIIWQPLSMSKSGGSRAWVTYVSIVPEKKLESLQSQHQVKVTLGHSQGIMSSVNSVYFNKPTELEFTVCIQRLGSENIAEMISWDDQNFHDCENHLDESSQIGTLEQFLKDHKDDFLGSSSWKLESIMNEIAIFRELLLDADWKKIGKLTLARLLIAHGAMKSQTCELVHSEVSELYNDLISLDPQHSKYYKEESSLVLLQQLISNPESLLGHCFQYRDSVSVGLDSYICLRLNNLSLSRFGSTERLLWVQMLDLSHNQLSSVEGLEAMQLLWCLNISNNKICSFSALEPLKLLKYLKVLNISNNEIGAHSLDTTRYLCSSTCPDTVASNWNTLGEFVNIQDGDVSDNYYGAYSFFKDLQLTQLDIIGNDVVDDNFKLFLVKIMSTLKWLDGLEV